VLGVAEEGGAEVGLDQGQQVLLALQAGFGHDD
jgi:hypothetical protein